jgi:hypothetical protein
MQEVNFKRFYNFQFILLTFLVWTRYDVCTGNFSLKIYGVVPWRGSVKNIILLHTHTHTHTHTYTHHTFSKLH